MGNMGYRKIEVNWTELRPEMQEHTDSSGLLEEGRNWLSYIMAELRPEM
jgi:hypothetical protein